MELQIQSALLEDYIEEIPGIIDFSSPFIYVNRIEIEKRTADPIKSRIGFSVCTRYYSAFF